MKVAFYLTLTALEKKKILLKVKTIFLKLKCEISPLCPKRAIASFKAER